MGGCGDLSKRKFITLAGIFILYVDQILKLPIIKEMESSNYQSPQIEVIEVEIESIICASGFSIRAVRDGGAA